MNSDNLSKIENYIPRLADNTLQRKLRTTGAVVIQGPKWCGKTTTAAYAAKSILKMDNADMSSQYKSMANQEPRLLLEGETPRLIDEWQVAPNLWNAVRNEVDNRRQFGQFILTGSAVPNKMGTETHSGTGRFAWMKMRPLTLYESNESNGCVSLKELFEGKEPLGLGIEHNLKDLAYIICRGGWPIAINQESDVALAQAINYYDAVINEDIIRASEENCEEKKLDPDRAKRVLRSYARNLAQQIPLSVLRKDTIANDEEKFSENTLYSYLSFLKRIFVIEDSPSWNPNLRSKSAIRTTDTRYFSDPSIGTAALGIGPLDLVNDLKTMGFFFENLCIRDLRVYADVLDGNIYHYRDSSGLECDAVLHLRNGKYGLIEIKLGSDNLVEEGAKHLLELEKKLDTERMNKPSFKMVLTGKSNFTYKREDGVFVVPIGCLKP